MKTTKNLIPILLLLASCASQPLPEATPLDSGMRLVPAAPAKGFHYPYILRIPDGARASAHRILLVEPNNTGKISDDLEVHLDGAKRLVRNGLGAAVADALDIPILMPVFPRPETDWHIYTHQLDRDAMRIDRGPMRRLDLQLIAMIDDARARLAREGLDVPRDVLMAGFSASATFVNRFVMLHPERVRATATGGLNALVMLPLAQLDSVTLDYPLGIADARERIHLDRWRLVPQYIFMGEKDDNDAVLFDDGYSEVEREAVFRAIGKPMRERWERGQAIYREAGANATFRTYEGIGHGTNRQIHDDVAEFLRNAIAR